MKNYGIVLLIGCLFLFQPTFASDEASADLDDVTSITATTDDDSSSTNTDGIATDDDENQDDSAATSTTTLGSSSNSTSLFDVVAQQSVDKDTTTPTTSDDTSSNNDLSISSDASSTASDSASESIDATASVIAPSSGDDLTINDITDDDAIAKSSSDTNAISSDVTDLASVVNAAPLVTPAQPKIISEETTENTLAVSSDNLVTSIDTTSGATTAVDLPVATEDDISVNVTDSQQIDLDTTMTVGVGGNWLQKRVYYEKAAALYEDIQEMVNTSSDVRLKFLNEMKSLESSVDSFYETVKYTQGQLDEMLDAYTTALQNEVSRDGDLSEDERAIQQTIVDEKTQVQEIGSAITALEGLDDKMDELIQLVFTTIDSCRDYQSEAWDNFKQITQSLDDQQARTLYYEMENYSENIQQQLDYLNNTLFPFFQGTLGAQITSSINTVESAVNDMKSKGVDIGKQINVFFGDDVTEEEQRKQYDIDSAVQDALDDYKQQESEKRAQKEAQEAAEKQEELEGSFWYKFVTRVLCPLRSAASWLGEYLTFLQPVGEAIGSAAAFAWQGIKSLFCLLCCWVSKLKFW